MTPAVFAVIIVALLLAGAAGFAGIRLGERRAGPTLVAGLLMLALALGIVAILSVTFFRRTVSA